MAEDEETAAELKLAVFFPAMVLIREKKNEWNVFPPANHENLPPLHRRLLHLDEEQLTPPSSDFPFSPSNSSVASYSTSSFPPSEDGDQGENQSESIPRGAISVDLASGVGNGSGWWGIGCRVLLSKLWGFAGWPLCPENVAPVRGFYFRSLAPAAAALLWLFYWRIKLWGWRNWRLRREERLMLLVKEKDEKISQLLNQIAQMNELLISRHKLSSR